MSYNILRAESGLPGMFDTPVILNLQYFKRDS